MTGFPLLALAAVAAAVLLALAALVALRRAQRRLAVLEDSVRRLREDTDAVGAGGLEALARLDRMEPALAGLADRLGTVELRAEGGSYDRAIAAAKAGASAPDLERGHGLSPAEAGLIVAVHGRR
ncbi:MAG: DUF2802 domain-containing protein [Steroidobacteraceae bacterium]|jgi:hypothetical protein|nr:DUF2802 domain-containing protein [Steroidobacteraceae bacterium]